MVLSSVASIPPRHREARRRGPRLVQRGVAHALQLLAVVEGEPGGVARHDREVLREAQQHQALQRGQVLAVQRVLGRALIVDVRQERVAPHVRLQAPGVLRGARRPRFA